MGGLYQTEASLHPSLEAQMRSTIAFALLNIAVTGVLTLVYRKQEDRVNSFVRNTGKIQERNTDRNQERNTGKTQDRNTGRIGGSNKRAVLTQTEEMMVREEIFLESLASKLARRENAVTVDIPEWVPRLKSFLKTFRERPQLQTKGRHLFSSSSSVHFLLASEKSKRKYVPG